MNLFLKPKALILLLEGTYTHSGTSGLFDRPYLCLRGIPSKPPLTTPNDLAGARPTNTQKALRLKISNYSLRSLEQ